MTAVAFPEDCVETGRVLAAAAKEAGRDPSALHAACTLRVNINSNKERAGKSTRVIFSNITET